MGLHRRSPSVRGHDLVAAGRAATGLSRTGWLHGANKGARELAVDLGGNNIHVESFSREDVACFFGAVNARWLNSMPSKPAAVNSHGSRFLVQGTSDVPTHRRMLCRIWGDLAARHHVRHGEPASRLQHAIGLAQHLVFIGRKIDDAVEMMTSTELSGSECSRSRLQEFNVLHS